MEVSLTLCYMYRHPKARTATGDGAVHAAADQCLVRELVDSMITHDPDKRPTANHILRHPFFWSRDRQLRFFEV